MADTRGVFRLKLAGSLKSKGEWVPLAQVFHNPSPFQLNNTSPNVGYYGGGADSGNTRRSTSPPPPSSRTLPLFFPPLKISRLLQTGLETPSGAKPFSKSFALLATRQEILGSTLARGCPKSGTSCPRVSCCWP